MTNAIPGGTSPSAIEIEGSGNWISRNVLIGNNASFGNNPLWIPRYGSSLGALPASWRWQTIWQYADHGAFPGDHDYFNGAYDRLQAFTH